MSKKNQISYSEPSQPSFIRAFKQKAGYIEGPTLSDKFEPEGGKPEDEIDPKQELLEMINSNQLSIDESQSCDMTKENLKDVLEGKDLAAIAAEREKKEQEMALKEAAKLPYDEKRDGKIVYRPPPPSSSKKKRASEDDQLEADNNSSKRSKEKQVNKRLLTCIPSDEDESSNDD
ncbi:hypothetical protein LOD99_2579 [Oopsacas minuta]|uniref:DUF4604 domain-containing protein n=1 Tax=Oopsacas minuta TaxID=111878 RepID=A0AAV7K274_9METZ|nr:hypothetical protein LOD99_2579 [Oopsacas minuta]